MTEPPNKRQKTLDTAKPSAIAKASGGRRYTVSLALPGGIIKNAQTLELKTALAGQIARAAAIFNVDEVVIFDEEAHAAAGQKHHENEQDRFREKNGGFSEANIFLARILQYLETPQYLRKRIFPMHRDLRYVGLLAPLDCPHHLRIEDACPYREGVVLSAEEVQRDGYDVDLNKKSVIDIGLRRKCVVDRNLPATTRVTVSMGTHKPSKTSYQGHGHDKALDRIDVAPPTAPREKLGYYWGYRVRLADSLSSVFTECGFDEGYDLTLGTSERGKDLGKVVPELPKFKHLLVVFGGLAGLEHAIERDPKLDLPPEEAEKLFDRWVNAAPDQGSRTIRTEEAVLLVMAQLRNYVPSRGIK
ncbi:hypothetical protein PYCC9005_004983 [Savitreella phatthalungensis]